MKGRGYLALGYRTYADYLRSAHWADVKHRYRTSDLRQNCYCCGDDEVQLHHCTYDRIGHEELTDLVPLCGRCHSLVHVLERRGDITLDLQGLLDAERARRNRESLAVQGARRDREDVDVKVAVLVARERLPIDERITLARKDARASFIDVRDEVRLLQKMQRDGRRHGTIVRQLRRLEAKAYHR